MCKQSSVAALVRVLNAQGSKVCFAGLFKAVGVGDGGAIRIGGGCRGEENVSNVTAVVFDGFGDVPDPVDVIGDKLVWSLATR